MGFFLVVLASFAAGAINAVAGGGTFLTFPALTYFGGLTDLRANVTSTIGLWPGSASSVAAAWGEFRKLPKGIVIPFSIISLAGGAAGSLLLLHTSPNTFSLIIPWLLGFATIVFACSKPIARWAGRQHGDRSLRWTIIVGVVQMAVAVYGGYFGAGIGVLMLAGLAFAGLDNIHQMNALKVLLATLINGVSCVIFLFGPVAWKLAPPMAVASIIGGFLGMYAARRIRQDQLRALILAVGITLTIVYFVKNYRGGFARHSTRTEIGNNAGIGYNRFVDIPRTNSAFCLGTNRDAGPS
jgi:hypothetical protein